MNVLQAGAISKQNETFTKDSYENKENSSNHNATFTKAVEKQGNNSVEVTPDQKEKAKKNATAHNPNNYNINDIKSDDSTDDESAPRKQIPTWAQGLSYIHHYCCCLCQYLYSLAEKFCHIFHYIPFIKTLLVNFTVQNFLKSMTKLFCPHVLLKILKLHWLKCYFFFTEYDEFRVFFYCPRVGVGEGVDIFRFFSYAISPWGN